jgi:hypothetical protein
MTFFSRPVSFPVEVGAGGPPRWNCGRWSQTPTTSIGIPDCPWSPTPVRQDPGVAALLATDGVVVEAFSSPLRGVEGEVRLWRVRLSTQAGDS